MIGLSALLEEHGEAIEADLLREGYRLRWLDSPAQDFNWRDLFVLVKTTTRDSMLFRSMHGDDEAEWGLTEQLLAMSVDTQNVMVWMKTKDAQRNPPKNRPKPIPRPGVEPERDKIGGDKLPVAEMMDWLGEDYAVLVA